MDTAPSTEDSSLACYQLPAVDEDFCDTSRDDTYDAQRDRSLLWQNAIWFCHLRWIVIGGLATAGVAAFFPNWTARFGLQLAPEWSFAAATSLAVANLAYLLLLRRLPKSAPANKVRLLLWGQIVVDLVILTGVIHFLGSRNTYAPFTYLFHIILACIFFRRMESLGVTAVSTVLYVGCLLLEFQGILSPQTVLTDTGTTLAASGSRSLWIWHLVSLLAIWSIIWYLASRLADALRGREHELAATNRRLEASSEERARHMLQTTHQLKAPFAAIHANTQLLLGGYCGKLPEASAAVVEKISLRARMLSQQIQDMLQLANLRSEAQAMPRTTTIALDELIETAVARMEPTASLRGIRVETDVEVIQVRAVEDYLKMLVDNLLSNAVSYSYDGGLVSVACRRGANAMAVFVVRDHGIGIPAEKISQVFRDYYRTKEAAQHNKASTGLGLAIVRHVVRALKMSVTVESAPGWGSRFTVQMSAIPDDPISRLVYNRSL